MKRDRDEYAPGFFGNESSQAKRVKNDENAENTLLKEFVERIQHIKEQHQRFQAENRETEYDVTKEVWYNSICNKINSVKLDDINDDEKLTTIELITQLCATWSASEFNNIKKFQLIITANKHLAALSPATKSLDCYSNSCNAIKELETLLSIEMTYQLGAGSPPSDDDTLDPEKLLAISRATKELSNLSNQIKSSQRFSTYCYELGWKALYCWPDLADQNSDGVLYLDFAETISELLQLLNIISYRVPQHTLQRRGFISIVCGLSMMHVILATESDNNSDETCRQLSTAINMWPKAERSAAAAEISEILVPLMQQTGAHLENYYKAQENKLMATMYSLPFIDEGTDSLKIFREVIANNNPDEINALEDYVRVYKLIIDRYEECVILHPQFLLDIEMFLEELNNNHLMRPR